MNLINGQQCLPVEIVFHPSWWNAHAGIVFDEDFFYHPKKRVESERRMEQFLYDNFGKFGLGEQHDEDLPVVGAVHNAAGYLVSEMLGCEIRYKEDAAPTVLPANRDTLSLDPETAFKSEAFRRFSSLCEELKKEYGYLTGDVNWSGILNLALDVRGQSLFLDMIDAPEAVHSGFKSLYEVLSRFVTGIQAETKSSSISVNRLVRLFAEPLWLHSECSNTMISTEDYERFLLPYDVAWSQQHRPFGIHHCGKDAHRFVENFAKIPHLDFLDVGWGGDLEALRKKLPDTFLNIRLDPVQFVHWTPFEIRSTIIRLVSASGNLALTGVCCVNVDHRVRNEQVHALFETVAELRKKSPKETASRG